MRVIVSCAIACVVAHVLPLPAAAQDAVADFYKGKQVAITVGFASGGSASLYSQVLARHMSRHMPGNPSFEAKVSILPMEPRRLFGSEFLASLMIRIAETSDDDTELKRIAKTIDFKFFRELTMFLNSCSESEDDDDEGEEDEERKRIFIESLPG